MSDTALATRLANWVAALDHDRLPPRAVEMAKLLILDQLGLQVRGATLPNVQPERTLVDAMKAAPESTAVLSPTRTVAPYAAFVNGTLAAGIEYDDVHMFAAHIGSAVVPAALAFGERTGASGRDVITAVVAGAQVMSLLGATTVTDMVRAGWHASKILGTFGATAAAGKLLGLTPEQLTHALGIAGSDAAGTMEYELSGGEVKRMHSGAASRSGCQAALLAQAGLTGPTAVIEGERGVLRLLSSNLDVAAIDKVWEHFHIVDTIFRMYPTIGSAGPAIEAARHLQEQHDLSWREISEIKLGLPEIAVGHGAAIIRPTDAVTAQFSTAFSIALRLVRGQNRPQEYLNPDLWTDPDLLSVVDKVVPYPTEFAAGMPALLSCRLDITLTDGRVLSHTQGGMRGYPNHPDTRDSDIESKFLDNVDGILTATDARKIVEHVDAFDRLDGLTDLMTLLAASPGVARTVTEMTMARLNPPDPDTIPSDIGEFLAKFPPDTLFTMLSHSPTTIQPFIALAQALYTSLKLPVRARELAILTVAENTRCEFVATQHVPISERAGVNEDVRQAIRNRDWTSASLSEHDRAVIQFATEIVRQSQMSDAVFASARKFLSDREIVELLHLCGYYWTLSRVCTVLQVDLTQLYAQVSVKGFPTGGGSPSAS